MNFTRWFPGYIKPTRVGVYQLQPFFGKYLYSHWNGSYWCMFGKTISDAIRMKNAKAFFQTYQWRGILK